MNLNVGDLGIADSTLVVLDARVHLPIVLQHLGQRVEPQRTVRALVVLVIGHVTRRMPGHSFRLPGPEGAATLAAINPFIVKFRMIETRFSVPKILERFFFFIFFLLREIV